MHIGFEDPETREKTYHLQYIFKQLYPAPMPKDIFTA